MMPYKPRTFAFRRVHLRICQELVSVRVLVGADFDEAKNTCTDEALPPIHVCVVLSVRHLTLGLRAEGFNEKNALLVDSRLTFVVASCLADQLSPSRWNMCFLSGTEHHRRQAAAVVRENGALVKLFEVLGPRYK